MGDPPLPPDKRARIHKLVDDFFDQEQTADQQNRAIMIKKTLSADVVFLSPKPILPADDIAERHAHAKDIQKKLQSREPGFSLTAIQVAVILTVPLSQLRPNGNLSATTQSLALLKKTLNELVRLSHHYLNRYTDAQFKEDSTNNSTQPPSKKSASVSSKRGSNKRPYTEDEKDGNYKPDDKPRGSATKKAVQKRDGNACVFLRTSNPEVAHIIPVSWNLTDPQIRKTDSLLFAMQTLMAEKNREEDWASTNSRLLADATNPGSSDHPWNAICMNHQLHFWFDRGLIGLKFLGNQPITDDPPMSQVDIQFNWMMRDDRKRARDMHIGGENDSFMDMVTTVRTFQDKNNPAPQLPSQDGIVAALHAKNGVPLVSGRCIKMEVPTGDVSKLQTVLDLQWACVKIATMAGSAGWPEFPPDPDEEGDAAPTAVREWVLEQSVLAMQQPDIPPLQTTTNRPPRGSSPSKTRHDDQARHSSDGSPTKLSLRVQTRDSSPSKVSRTEQSQGQQQQPQARGSENVRPHDM
ncbi:uncharacterized protein BKA55DRAFT_546778 [Fusarium redolens]|uniref:HNH nuclease domain-containing protein n=1 Tax=Fusarium redolens TaxID=48865 RepID=A0A9P9JPH9_FUSRE|nr:uncharacterized protein BKA55DRAFT_546778 [Fusarium redolens]KAH7210699.1 hypothetical protein BKA55DRAFT_546778 [Fusarium redolens]